VLAELVKALADGASLQDALPLAKSILKEVAEDIHKRPDDYRFARTGRWGRDAHWETLNAIEKAESLAVSSMTPHEAIAELGQGWVAEEALSISIYCALVARDFREGVILAVNHDGDSDSTGAITGNLLGTMHGVGAIPASWLEPLELRAVITEVAEDMHGWREWKVEWPAGVFTDRRIHEKYPGG
jgi:ADP-ribosylglycohydrolase